MGHTRDLSCAHNIGDAPIMKFLLNALSFFVYLNVFHLVVPISSTNIIFINERFFIKMFSSSGIFLQCVLCGFLWSTIFILHWKLFAYFCYIFCFRLSVCANFPSPSQITFIHLFSFGFISRYADVGGLGHEPTAIMNMQNTSHLHLVNSHNDRCGSSEMPHT